MPIGARQLGLAILARKVCLFYLFELTGKIVSTRTESATDINEVQDYAVVALRFRPGSAVFVQPASTVTKHPLENETVLLIGIHREEEFRWVDSSKE